MQPIPPYPRDPAQERSIPVSQLFDFVQKLLIKNRMFPGDAKIATERMVEADLRGMVSHGTWALKRYIPAMEMCDIDPRADVVTEVETPAIAVLNAGQGLGHVAATKAMLLAIEKAERVGTGTVVVKKGQHYGACGVYTQLAADAEMIGYTTTLAGRPNVLAYGSTAAAETNHGSSWAAPLKDRAPLVLDMAVAESSWGKIDVLRAYGLSIPENWALDKSGQPTTDPALAALLEPLSGPRGFGLALISTFLTAGLGNGKPPLERDRSPESEGAQHFFYAIDVKQFLPLERYYARMSAGIDQILELPLREGFDRVTYPGQREAELAEKARDAGVPLHQSHLHDLEELGKKHRVEIPWN